MTVPSRRVVWLLLALAVLPFIARLLSPETAFGSAARVVAAGVALAIVPGALLTIASRFRKTITALELVGFGFGLSFITVHLLTVVMMAAHVSAAVLLGLMSIAVIAAAIYTVWQRDPMSVTVGVDEAVIGAALVVLAALLYIQGSPVDSFEDVVHSAVVRRLSALGHPTVGSFYFGPGITYTYPIPGTHTFMALVTRLSALDALFVYHKLRFLWGPLAIVMLHLAACSIFGSSAVAAAVSLTAVALTLNGAFAMVEGTFWGQLAVYSHPSDIAMTVLLPALLVMAFAYLTGGTTRERTFFAGAALLLAFVLAAVHIREIIQALSYLAAFILVCALFRDLRRYLRPTVFLFIGFVIVTGAYLLWQRSAVPAITELVEQQNDKLLAAVHRVPARALLTGSPPALFSDFFFGFNATFNRLNPLLLFLTPLVVVRFRRQPLVWLIAASTLIYALVIAVPLAAFAYLYTTYYEILFMPVRNFVFFMYLVAGAAAYAVVELLVMRTGRALGVIATAAAGTAIGAFALVLMLTGNRSHAGFLIPMLAASAMPFVLRLQGARFVRYAVVAVLAVAVLPLLRPENPPRQPVVRVNVRWAAAASPTERAAIERQLTLEDPMPTDHADVWTYTLADPSPANARAIVTHPLVADTSHINRSTYQVERAPAPWYRYPGRGLAIAAALTLWVIAFLVPTALATRDVSAANVAVASPVFLCLAFATLLAPFATMTAAPELSPISLTPVPPSGRASTPREMVQQMGCVTRDRMAAPFTDDDVADGPLVLERVMQCPPDADVWAWVNANVPPEAIFAVSRFNYPLPSEFFPQQVDVFPGFERAFADEQGMFNRYYPLYHEAIRRYRDQPFFNVTESDVDRMRFLEAVGATHVLIDPAQYDRMVPILSRLDGLTRLYAKNRWAVYAVRSNSAGPARTHSQTRLRRADPAAARLPS